MKAHGLYDLLCLMDLGITEKKSDIGDAMTPIVDLMEDIRDHIDQLSHALCELKDEE